MSRLTWNTVGTRFFEAGVDRGVLYVDSSPGIPWIGLVSVDADPKGGDATPFYIDGEKYLNLSASEEFEATIKAFTYPVEFSECDGTSRVRDGLFFSQQPRKSFGFSYRTMVGNDVDGTKSGYKIHLIYNALAAPSSRSAATFNDSIDVSDFSWNLTTKPVKVSGYRSVPHVVVDSRYTDPFTLSSIEDILYGTDDNAARLPTPEELIILFDTPIVFTVTDNGDGSYFVGGPADSVVNVGTGIYTVDYSTVVTIDADTSTISS